MKSNVLSALFSLALICFCSTVARAEDEQDTSGLDDLPGKVEPKDKKDADDLDRELIKSLGGDKGTADAKGDDALDRAIRGMRDAGRRIEEEELDDETHDIQEKVVAELDELIKQLKRRPPPSQQNSKPQNEDQQDQQNQKQKNQKQQQPQNSDKQKQKSQQKQGSSKQQQSKSEQSKEEKSQDSSDKIRNEKAKTAEEQRREKLDRDVWGHLPPSLREKLLNVSSEKFLPKYEEMVRSYYEALAERNRQAQ
jgi:hypothetical protein